MADHLLRLGVKLDFTGNQQQFLAAMQSQFASARSQLLAQAQKASPGGQGASATRQLSAFQAQTEGRIQGQVDVGAISRSAGDKLIAQLREFVNRLAAETQAELRRTTAPTANVRPPTGNTKAYAETRDAARATEVQSVADSHAAADAQKEAARVKREADAAAARAERERAAAAKAPKTDPEKEAARAETQRIREEAAAQRAQNAADAAEATRLRTARRLAAERDRGEPLTAEQKADEEARKAVAQRMPTLSKAAQGYYQRSMADGTGAARAEGAGKAGALDRLFGLWTGTATELESFNTVLPGLSVTIGQMSSEARANLTSLQRMRLGAEELAKDEQLVSDLLGLTGRDLAGNIRNGAGAARARQLLEADARRQGTEGLIPDEAANRVADRRRSRDIETEATGLILPEDLQADARLRRVKAEQAASVKLITTEETLASKESVQAAGRVGAARVRLEKATKAATAEELRATGFGETGVGGRRPTVTQWIQKYVADRAGQNPRGADEFQTGRQLFASRALTTASFAASGGLLYGALNLGGDIIRESTELQKELGIIKTQFELVDKTANGITFDKFREQIRQTAVETGTEANDVANVQRQLAGAFASESGTPNFDRAAVEGKTALKYSKISPLPQQEITDSLSAVSLAFRDVNNQPLPFENILDTITDLENRFGVLGPEILKFTADLAPLGKELGFTNEQLSGLGAVAQQKSGKSGAVLSEQLGRILPSLQDKRSDLYDLLSQNQNTQKSAGPLLAAFSQGNTVDALKIIIESYGKLDSAQKKYLASLVGSRREAATFYALLDSPHQTIDVLNGGSKTADGAFEKRWEENRKTVSYSTERMRRAIEEFGQKLFSAGLDDGLKTLADGAAAFGTALSGVVDLFGELNDVTGGYLPKIAAIALAWTTISRASSRVGGAEGILQFITRGAVSGRVGLTEPGGALSPYTRGPAVRDESGAITSAGPILLRKSTERAANSTLLRGLITTGADGEIVAGAGTAVAGALAAAAPIVAAALAAKATSDIIEYRNQVDEGRKGLREQIKAALDKGLSPAEILRRAKGAAGKDTGGWDQLNSFLGNDAFKAAKSELEKELAARQEKRVEDQVNAIAAALGEQDNNGTTSDAKDLRDALRKGLEGKGLDEQVRAKLNELGFFRDGGGPRPARDRRGNTYITTPDPKARVGKKQLADLAKYVKDNAENPEAQKVAQAVIDLVPTGELKDQLQQILDEAGKPPKPTKAQKLDTATTQFASFDERIKGLQTAHERGRSSIQPIIRALNAKRRDLQGQLDIAIKNADETTTALLQGQIDEINKTYGDTTVTDVQSAADFRTSILDALGKNEGTAGTANAVDSARSSYEQIRAAKYTTDQERADAAVKLIAAQRADLDAQLKAATDPKKIADLVAQKVSSGLAVRTDVVKAQLQTGPLSKVRDSIATFFGIAAGDADAIISNAITSSKDINDSMLHAALEGEKRQIEAAIARLRAGGKEGAGAAGVLKQLEGRLAGVNAILGSLPTLDTAIDPGAVSATDTSDPANIAKLQRELEAARLSQDPQAAARKALANARADRQAAEAAGNKEAALQAQIAEVQAQQQLDSANDAVSAGYEALASARVERDPVAAARQQLSNAGAAVGRANGTAERLSALAAQVQAQHALEDAMEAMYQAQMDVANAISESLGKTVEVANRQAVAANEALRRAQANGTGGAALEQLRAAAIRANTNAVNVQREDRIGDLDFLYEMDKITANEYIKGLKAELAKIPLTNKAARQEIERKIRGIRDELSQNSGLNIGEIDLPSLYEARAVGLRNQATGGAINNYDQRVVTITVVEAGDVRRTTRAVAEAMGAAPRNGVSINGEIV